MNNNKKDILRRKKLDVENKKIYDESKWRYSSPKITKVFNNKGIKSNQKRVERRMKVLGLRSIIIKKYNHSSSTNYTDNPKEYKNILA